MTSDLSEIVDDPALNQELTNCHEDGNWDKRVIKWERICVRTGPFVVSNEACKKELQKAYNSIESLKIQTVIKLNKHYELLKTLWHDYFKLSKESQNLMNEINARESFALATNCGMKLSREMQFQTTKLQDDLAVKRQKLNKEPEKKMEVDNAPDTSEVKNEPTNEMKDKLLPSDRGCDSDMKMNLSSSDHLNTILPAKLFKRFKCEFCKQRYVDKRSFMYHVEAHAGKKYYCELCPKRMFKNKMSYDRHLKFHAGGKQYISCEICGNKFEEFYQLTSHKKKHEIATLPCLYSSECKRKFKHKGDQRRHSEFGHRETKDFPCKVCGKLFQSPHTRSIHERKCWDLKETDKNSMLDQMSGHDLSTLLKSKK